MTACICEHMATMAATLSFAAACWLAALIVAVWKYEMNPQQGNQNDT